MMRSESVGMELHNDFGFQIKKVHGRNLALYRGWVSAMGFRSSVAPRAGTRERITVDEAIICSCGF
jgi:hypothetical protein